MKRIHGVISLVLGALAVLTGAVAVLQASLGWGIFYLGMLAIAGGIILTAYCAKCPCREHGCGHVLVGPLTRFLPKRREGAYRWYDYFGVGICFAFIIIFPQPWLWTSLPWLCVFWALLGLAIIEIIFKVCPRCANPYCPMSKTAE